MTTVRAEPVEAQESAHI